MVIPSSMDSTVHSMLDLPAWSCGGSGASLSFGEDGMEYE